MRQNAGLLDRCSFLMDVSSRSCVTKGVHAERGVVSSSSYFLLSIKV